MGANARECPICGGSATWVTDSDGNVVSITCTSGCGYEFGRNGGMEMVTKEVQDMIEELEAKACQMGHYWNGTEAAGDASDILRWVKRMEKSSV